MSRSVDPGHFFQTDTSDANAARKAAKSGNKNGDPVCLSSKILAVIADPIGAEAVYVAESAGTIRRVDLKTKDSKSEVYRGPTAPLTSLCIYNGDIYAGCWDKTIWSWPLQSSQPDYKGDASKSRQFHGHSDFVKTVACTAVASTSAQPLSILISGAQDAKIIIWNAQTGAKLKVLTGHARGVLSLAVLPALSSGDTIDLFSGGSEGQIRRWRITSLSSHHIIHDKETNDTVEAGPLSAHLTRTETDALAAAAASADKTAETNIDIIAVHETSVNALLFSAVDPDSLASETEDNDDDDDQSPVLYTASSDNTATLLPAYLSTIGQRQSTIEQTYQRPSATLPHADFVRAVTPLAAPDADLVATACRDEGVRVWDTSEAGGALLHCFDGHYEEVTGLAVVGPSLVSVSIDGTVRTWPGTRAAIEQAIEAERQLREEDTTQEETTAAQGVELDADEEAELAALMEDD